MAVAEVLQALIPGFAVPDESQGSFMLGYGALVLAIFTTTYTHPTLRYLRLLLILPAVYGLWDYGLSGNYPGPKRNVDMGMASLAIHGILKVGEVCLWGARNGPHDWPTWVTLGESPKDEGRSEQKPRRIIPFKGTFWGRICYAIDLMTLRGSSWYQGRAWDFAPQAILNQPLQPSPQLQFIARNVADLVKCYLTLDVLEQTIRSIHWDTTNPSPVTSLPIPQQLLFAFCCFAHIMMSIELPITFLALNFSLIGSVSTTWPPVFISPLSSKSLAEFWSVKYHTTFRRVNSVWAEGFIGILPRISSSTGRKFARAFLIFTVTLCFHLGLFVTVLLGDEYPHQPFFNPKTIIFFLLQPLGLALELFISTPLTKNLPIPICVTLRRLFAWSWMLWSGRYWADVWYSHGMLAYQERYIIYSPISKLRTGLWRA